MEKSEMMRIFKETDYVHRSGTPEELRAAEYLKNECEKRGISARIEAFPVPMAEVEEARVYADGIEIPANAVLNCGSGETEGELYYMPSVDRVSLAGAKGKIVLLDTLGIRHFPYKDLVDAGAAGILFRYGNMYYGNDDNDIRDLRAAVVGDNPKLLSAMLTAKQAVALVKNGVKRVRIVVREREYDGSSHNVIAEIPGKRNEFITLSAHYDSVATSRGSYDNMSGCVGILAVADALKDAGLNCGLRLVFCGSEERGLLGSKHYVRAHAAELETTALNVNLDMIGSYMGKFLAKVSAEEKLAGYISYMGAELGYPIDSRLSIYASDSSAFADKGVPAVSFARVAGDAVAPIHTRFDTPELVSAERMEADIRFITEFTRRMAAAEVFPVSREIPEKIKNDLDEYFFRKRADK